MQWTRVRVLCCCFFVVLVSNYLYRSTNSDKYKAARNSNTVKCVTIEWVKDSLKKGYALPFNLYTVKKCTSTPTKENEDVDPNFSTMSAIAPPNRFSERSVLQETAVSQIGCATPTLKRKSIRLFVGFNVFVNVVVLQILLEMNTMSWLMTLI